MNNYLGMRIGQFAIRYQITEGTITVKHIKQIKQNLHTTVLEIMSHNIVHRLSRRSINLDQLTQSMIFESTLQQ